MEDAEKAAARADGAIGYLENDEENFKVFEAAAKALRPGGKHFIDICNAGHAARYFPKKHWEAGQTALALAQFDWNPQTRRMTYGGWDIPYGQPAQKPGLAMENADSIRLYSLEELDAIYARLGMKRVAAYSDFNGAPASDRQMQLLVCSQKR